MFDIFLYKLDFLVVVISNDLDELIAICHNCSILTIEINLFILRLHPRHIHPEGLLYRNQRENHRI